MNFEWTSRKKEALFLLGTSHEEMEQSHMKNDVELKLAENLRRLMAEKKLKISTAAKRVGMNKTLLALEFHLSGFLIDFEKLKKVFHW